jgi:uncharacterized protein (DUF1330 family)
MAKGYWVTTYRSVSDPDALARYVARGSPVIAAHGGRIIMRGVPSRVYEGATAGRCVVVEFDSVDRAIAAYESAEYQEARSILKAAAERDVRIMEGA